MSARKFSLVIIVLFVIAAAILSLKWRSDNIFEKINIEGNYTVTKEEILNIAKLNDTLINTDEINIDVIQDRISRHPEIKKVFVSKRLPFELKIDIIERRPVAILNGENETKLIDEELEVFPFKNFTKLYDLPVVSGVRLENNPGKISRYNKEELRLALFIILNAYKESRTVYNNISEVNLSDTDKIVIYLSEDSSPFYFPRKYLESVSNPEYQNLILNKLKVFEYYIKQQLDNHFKKNVSYVDLRYTNQVVVNIKN